MEHADEVVLVSESREELQESLELWRVLLEDCRLKISSAKVEYLEFNVAHRVDLSLQDHKLPKVEAFKFLRFFVAGDGVLEREREIRHRMQTDWNSWKNIGRVM